jgi:hypothetical protein
MKLFRIFLIIWGTLICAFLISCGTENPSNSSGSQNIIPTITVGLSSTQGLMDSSLPVTTTNNRQQTAVAISSITPSLTNENSALANTNSWEYSWLRQKDCLIPCWLGITPFVTNLEEATMILQRQPFITNVKLSKYNPSVDWDWKDSAKGTGSVKYNPSTNLVERILISFPKPFRLEDINKIHGEPSHVWTGMQEVYYVNIVYLSKGILLYNTYEKKPLIDKDLLVSGVILTKPSTSIDDFIHARNYPAPQVIPVWQGYKDWQFYCPACNGLK